MIERVAKIARLHRVPVPHTNEATYVIDEEGRRWVAKRELDMGFEALLAEALTWLLAVDIRAPVPHAAFCEDQTERAWLSEVIPNVTHWRPEAASTLVNLDEMGAVLALDVLVLNEARHARNLLVQVRADSSERVWAIDADEALIGHPDDFERRLGQAPSVHNHARGIPVKRLEDATTEAARLLAALSADRIAELVAEACAIARDPDHETQLTDLLVRRAGAMPELVKHYLRDLEALP